MKIFCENRIASVCERIKEYLLECQDFSPGEYYGSFWSEKAYHGPLLDYNAGGSHHNRGAGSASLVFWLFGKGEGNKELLKRAETAFDWLVARQHFRGGWIEIQNNERPSDWEKTGLEELSTIETGFVVRALSSALLNGLPPKKSYMDCLMKAGLWQLSIEFPPGTGIFPHHERSPYNTLNAATHAAETLVSAHAALSRIYKRKVNIFFAGAARAVRNVLACQWENGCFPYRNNNGVTINYTALAAWSLLNILDLTGKSLSELPPASEIVRAIRLAAKFLRKSVAPDGSLLWETNETSSAKYNMWTYAITFNVLSRSGSKANVETAKKILGYSFARIDKSGLFPMRDRGETVTECAFMQADMLLFLMHFMDMEEKI